MQKIFLIDECLARRFNLCAKEDQEWVLGYLSLGKGTIPYEMITRYDSVDISPEDGAFSSLTNFTQALRIS